MHTHAHVRQLLVLHVDYSNASVGNKRTKVQKFNACLCTHFAQITHTQHSTHVSCMTSVVFENFTTLMRYYVVCVIIWIYKITFASTFYFSFAFPSIISYNVLLPHPWSCHCHGCYAALAINYERLELTHTNDNID